MTFSPEQIKSLDSKLDGSNVKSRKQAGRPVSYIESWHAINEANRIFGFDGWSAETVDIRQVAEHHRKLSSGEDGWGVSYTARVRVTAGGIVRDGIGAGHGIDRDLGQAHESAIKEAESDALKRALRTFGNQFGLALYDKEQEGVERAPQRPAQGERAAPPPTRRHEDIRAPQDRQTTVPTPEQRAVHAEREAAEMEKTARSRATPIALQKMQNHPGWIDAYASLPDDLKRRIDGVVSTRKAELEASLRMAG